MIEQSLANKATTEESVSQSDVSQKTAYQKLNLQRIHHVAYRCNDAKETVEFYQSMLNMDFQLAIAEDKVPSTQAPDPYMHVFLDAGNGNVLAFFELPNADKMDRDRNTPEWVQHIAFEVESIQMLEDAKTRLQGHGVDVLGPTDHGIFKSIYFFDPNGHRIELAANTGTPEMMAELKRVAPEMLDEWSKTKKAPKHAEWLHDGSGFSGSGFSGSGFSGSGFSGSGFGGTGFDGNKSAKNTAAKQEVY